jgi:hypothetical protein
VGGAREFVTALVTAFINPVRKRLMHLAFPFV